MAATVRPEIPAPIDALHINAQVFTVHFDDHKVKGIIPGIHTRFDQMLERQVFRFVRFEVFGEIRLSQIRIEGGTPTSADNLIEAVSFTPVRVPFHPVLEEMLMPREYCADVVLLKERHVSLPHFDCGNFDPGSSMFPR